MRAKLAVRRRLHLCGRELRRRTHLREEHRAAPERRQLQLLARVLGWPRLQRLEQVREPDRAADLQALIGRDAAQPTRTSSPRSSLKSWRSSSSRMNSRWVVVRNTWLPSRDNSLKKR